ncbi:hypothetical protein HEE30_002237 [Salmonella enterica]|nr:hypothetical protein [Salmonella enterica subsp. enterica serovar Litchfield]EEU7539264.1 hypothetical protein [Salmonella enterica]ELW3910415.1 hypothetical protein [Salmonella enterica subsp. enterica serovar Litchfield]
MNFRELPISVQNIAAQLLADKMPCATNTSENETAMALAQNISDAFTRLYNPMKTYTINYNSGRPGPISAEEEPEQI